MEKGFLVRGLMAEEEKGLAEDRFAGVQQLDRPWGGGHGLRLCCKGCEREKKGEGEADQPIDRPWKGCDCGQGTGLVYREKEDELAAWVKGRGADGEEGRSSLWWVARDDRLKEEACSPTTRSAHWWLREEVRSGSGLLAEGDRSTTACSWWWPTAQLTGWDFHRQ